VFKGAVNQVLHGGILFNGQSFNAFVNFFVQEKRGFSHFGTTLPDIWFSV